MNSCNHLLKLSLSRYSFAWNKTSYQITRSPPLLLTSPPFREKGHSKWQNIRHIKALKDGQKSDLFNKFILNMKIAIGEGGGVVDPKLNSKLANVIDNAKRHDMPVATIDNFLKKLKEKPQSPTWYEIKGPRGCVFYVVAFSMHPALVRQSIKTGIKRSKCSRLEIVDNTSLARNTFEQKGVILAEPPPGVENVEEASLDHAIEVGAEEVSPYEEDPKLLEFITPATGLQNVRLKLEELKYKIKDSRVNYIPKRIVELSEDELAQMEFFYNYLESLPEVGEIYINF